MKDETQLEQGENTQDVGQEAEPAWAAAPWAAGRDVAEDRDEPGKTTDAPGKDAPEAADNGEQEGSEDDKAPDDTGRAAPSELEAAWKEALPSDWQEPPTTTLKMAIEGRKAVDAVASGMDSAWDYAGAVLAAAMEIHGQELTQSERDEVEGFSVAALDYADLPLSGKVLYAALQSSLNDLKKVRKEAARALEAAKAAQEEAAVWSKAAEERKLLKAKFGRELTAEEIVEMKRQAGVSDPEKAYRIVYYDHDKEAAASGATKRKAQADERPKAPKDSGDQEPLDLERDQPTTQAILEAVRLGKPIKGYRTIQRADGSYEYVSTNTRGALA